MLAPGVAGLQTPEIWAGIGCGNGLFTQALAHVLPPASAIHAMDTDAPALRDIPRRIEQVDIRIWRGDFLVTPWPSTRSTASWSSRTNRRAVASERDLKSGSGGAFAERPFR